MFPYRMETASREQMAAEDPFSGHGAFLWMPGGPDDGERALERLRECTGMSMPAVAWGGIGVWADLRGADGMTRGELVSRWEGKLPWE